MGLLKILNAAKAITEFVTDENTIKAANNLKTLGRELSPSPNQEDFKLGEEDFNYFFNLSCSYASLLSHVSQLDGKPTDDAIDEYLDVINSITFTSEGLLPESVIELSNHSKKEIKNAVYDKLENPYSLKEISKFAIDTESEEDFYAFACSAIIVDEEITANEREFLSTFSSLLNLNKFDTRVIEKRIKDSL